MRGTLGFAVLAGTIAAPAAAEEVNLAGPGFVPVTVAAGVYASSVRSRARIRWSGHRHLRHHADVHALRGDTMTR